MKKPPSIAKITRPKPSGIVLPRTRLFRMLDAARGKPVTLVAAPAGSGKTTLIASYLDARRLPCLWYQVDEGDADLASFFYYMGLAARKAAPRRRKCLPLLTPEYLLGIPTFAQRFFEMLFERLKPPFAIVFDNFQDAPGDSPLHDFVARGLSLVPQGVRAFVVSRNEPPAFARMRVNGAMQPIGWDELRFTPEESKQMILLKDKRKISEGALAELHEKTEGWAAGLVLLMEGGGKKREPRSAGKPDPKEVFDYFAGEILGKLDGETADFLLTTSLLPDMTVRAAAKLTDKDNAGRILSTLHRNGFFTEKKSSSPEPSYRYHPLFREFLLGRMKEKFNADGILRMQKRAAALLEEEGWTEDALGLFLQAADWESAIRMIFAHAQIILMQGRNKTLEEWLSRIPRELIDSMPWLLYWSGMCRMGYDLSGARGELERALKRFTDAGDDTGMVLSWSFLVDALIFEWNDFHPLDQLITAFFEKIEKALPDAPPEVRAKAVTSIGLALLIRRPEHPRIAKFIAESTALSGKINDTDYRLHALMSANLYYSWVGDFSRCSALDEQIRRSSPSHVSQASRLLSRVLIAGRHLWNAASVEEADGKISEALEFGAKIGLHQWDHLLYALEIYGSFMTGDTAKAGRYLEKMGSTLIPSRKEMHVQYHLMSCWHQFLRGNFSSARSEAELSLKLTEETGYVFAKILVLHGMAQVLHALKDDKAGQQVEQALRLAVSSKSAILEFGCRLAKAQFALDNGKEKGGARLLREALSLGGKHGYYSLFWWWDPAAMSRLAVKALENGIEPEYVCEFIRLRKLTPESPPAHIENWPWPLKIYTLGTFRIERDGKPLVFGSKVQKKPLEMLKFVIAARGHNAPREQVIDALWPEAEGDAGHSAFKMALSRLRQLTGNDAIRLQEGNLSLDARRCWVDASAFERLLEQADAFVKDNYQPGRRRPGRFAKEDVRPAEKAMALYKGTFLPAEAGLAWTMSMRERLRGKYLGLAVAAGLYSERTGNEAKALACYQRALEVDDLAEELYQNLMACYLRLGRYAEALGVYQRCRSMLQAGFGIEPSPRTEALYNELINRK